MRKFFQKLRRDCRGAVTVFVTLLLIPAVLVSGTGVDLARLYTARSIVHDANQLAANSALASYDALLQDLYGLYGIMKDDPEFATMVDEYIQVAVFGEDWTDRGQGTFQLFYGSDLIPGEITPAEGKNLANQEVLRRQIEEYAKFRAPVIIVQEILDRLDVFEKVQKDAEIIKDKMEIDDKVEDIDKLYRDIYNCIQEVNTGASQENGAIQSVNAYLKEIEQQIDKLYETRSDYTEAVRRGDEDAAGDYELKYQGLIGNIHSLVVGGTFVDGWMMGNTNSSGEYESGYWSMQGHRDGLNKSISDRCKSLEELIANLTWKNDSLEDLVSLCERADEQRESLGQMVDNLEVKLNSGECSEDLKDGLTQPQGSSGKSVIEEYREILSYNLTEMANAMSEHDTAQINQFVQMLRNDVGYGNESVGIFYSLNRLKDLKADHIPIDLIIVNASLPPESQMKDELALMDSVTPKTYSISDPYYELFQSDAFEDTHNPEFYEKLEEFYAKTDNETKKDDITDGLEDMLGKIQDQFSSFLQFDPDGAWKYNNGSGGGSDNGTDFGSSGDWGSEDGAKDQVKKAMNDNLLSRLGSAVNDAANKILLLTYDTEMFSCYATNSGKTEDEPVEENMNGIPLGVDVNYYFQSEIEYLYNGDLTNAKANLSAVTSMLFLVRFVFNYIASFMVSDVTTVVDSVRTSLAFTGPFAIVAAELVRLIMALGESVIDVSRLKDGDNVALMKSDNTWRFSLSGQLDNIASGTVGELSSGSFSSGGGNDGDDEGVTLGYKDYLRLFLLLVDGNTLAQRTAKLIELNVTNKRENFGSLGSREEREQAMSSAQLFRMDNAITDFSITTSVELKMLFLSMPFAQQGVNGVVPPGTLPVSVTDYRGY